MSDDDLPLPQPVLLWRVSEAEPDEPEEAPVSFAPPRYVPPYAYLDSLRIPECTKDELRRHRVETVEQFISLSSGMLREMFSVPFLSLSQVKSEIERLTVEQEQKAEEAEKKRQTEKEDVARKAEKAAAAKKQLEEDEARKKAEVEEKRAEQEAERKRLQPGKKELSELTVVPVDVAQSSAELLEAMAPFKGEISVVLLKLLNPSKATVISCFSGLSSSRDWRPFGRVVAAVDCSDLRDITNTGPRFLFQCLNLMELNLSGMCAVNEIGDQFCCECESLQKVDLSAMANITSVGREFLVSCSQLATVDLAPLKLLSRIEDSFLSRCESLLKIDASPLENVAHIGDDFISYCGCLEVVHLPAKMPNLFRVGSSFLAWNGKLGRAGVDLKPLSKVVEVGAGFLGQNALEKLDATPLVSLCKIGNGFLSNCRHLTELDMSTLDQIESVGTLFLNNCYALKRVKLSDALLKLDNVPNSAKQLASEKTT